MAIDKQYMADDQELVKKFIDYLDNTDFDRKIYLKNHQHDNKRTARKSVNMWGEVQHTTSCGVGAKYVSCSGHGGFLISPARQHTIPEPLREWNPYYADGCGVYEEDCDFNIYTAFYPKGGMKVSPHFLQTEHQWREYSANYLVENYRDKIIEVLSNV